MIKSLVDSSIEKRRSFLKDISRLRLLPAATLDEGVPTLRSGQRQSFSPQLKERYELFGRWETATHGHWLGLGDMEGLWQETINDDFLNRIKSQRIACEEGWSNSAPALFKPERLSLFACSDLTNEQIYLLWLEFEDEPELWVYDSNGESRYKDLEEYLRAYLSDDVSASARSWRVAARS